METGSTQSNFGNGDTPGRQDASENPNGPLNSTVATPGHGADPARGRFFLLSKARALAIARQRRQTLRRFIRLRKHYRLARAAQMVGASVPTLWRWHRQFKARGLAGLVPDHPGGGPPSIFAAIRFPVRAVRELERLRLETGNPRTAWRQFAYSPDCPPIVARHVQRRGRAPALLINLGKINPVKARVFVSADRRRVYVVLPTRGVVSGRIALPANLKLCTPRAT
jgi:transposase-like protein